jgi:hypothetical protein
MTRWDRMIVNWNEIRWNKIKCYEFHEFAGAQVLTFFKNTSYIYISTGSWELERQALTNYIHMDKFEVSTDKRHTEQRLMLFLQWKE